ncbi:uncharacterized protein FIBRA_03380 [Fibroporia radiculosa]|uniref:Uncharacterized protein n=1 Tax=Fibroporia radiculosa TaxID=599839 RepID=J4I9K7_9APHY|nr:uncharacterized protein FIBRA_03380 [Fibroporia radiculosa]CCM01331.1 predicted protein [Fibroporia radiculosa]
MATSADGASQADSPSNAQSWDGDKMFNIYIYDYCLKRGYTKTAEALVHDAAITPDSQPPINAKQGLLFEWWSVFWVLFTAKSSMSGPDDAMLYVQHQSHRQQQARISQPPQPRMLSGVPRPGPNPPNGPIPNGVAPNGVASTQGPMPNGTQSSFAGASHMNGTSGPSGVPGASAPSQPPGAQQVQPGQRPVGVQQRVPREDTPYRLAAMPYLSQNPSAQGQQHNPAAALGSIGNAQLSNQMNSRGMLPPNAHSSALGPSHTPQPGFQQPHGRSPSQPNSPGPNGMIPSPSPSLQARAIPNMHTGDIRLDTQMLNEILRLPQEALHQLRQEAGVGDKDLPSLSVEEKQRLINVAKRKGQLTPYKQGPLGPPGPSNAAAGPSTSISGPPNQQRNPQMPPDSQHPPQGQPQGQAQQQQIQQQQQQRGNKRNSASPGHEQEQIPRNDASPPDRKRLRVSSTAGEPPQQPPMTPLAPGPYHGLQPGGPGGPSHMPPNGMMRPMFPGHQAMQGMGNNPGMNMAMSSGLGGPQQMGNTMSPGMMNHPPPNGMMNNQQISQMQYRQTMHNLHKNNIPHGALSTLLPPGVTGSPPAFDNVLNMAHGLRTPAGQYPPGVPAPPGGPPNRMGQNKPMGNMMPPPPSPSMSAPKNMAGPNKDGSGGDSSAPNGRVDASPQNAPAGVGQGQPPPSGGAPAGTSTAPHTPSNQPPAGSMPAPSPSAMMNNSSTPSMAPSIPPGPPAPDLGASLFSSADFSMGPGLDEFSFGQDGGGALNFEEDFREWFSSDSVTGVE